MGWAKSAQRTSAGWGRSTAGYVTANPDGFFGVAVADGNLTDAYPGRTNEINAYAAIGAKFFRTDFRQSSLGGGSYTTQDAIASDAASAGLKMLGILDPSTDLSVSGDRTTYGSYCGTIAARYSANYAWEICNEPNISGSTKVARTDYVQALPLAFAAIRAANPAAIVVAGALGGIQDDSGDYEGTDECVAAYYDNAPGAFDAISTHYYTDSSTYNWSYSTSAGWHCRIIHANVKAVMAAKGDLDRQIYVTETGIHTYGAGFTEAWQDQWVREASTDLLLDTRVEQVFLYTRYNNTGDGSAQATYGQVTTGGTPKRAAHTFARLAALYSSAAPAFEVDKGADSYIPAFRFFKDATSPSRRRLSYSLIGAPTGVTIDSTTGIITVATATASAQAATALTVRAAHQYGGYLDLSCTLAINNPNLVSNGDFAASGNVNGWTNAGTATVSYDAGQGAMLVNITGTGGGATTSNITVEAGAVYQIGWWMKKGTYTGTLLNVFMDTVATSPSTITVPSDYALVMTEYTAGDTSAPIAFARNGANTGTIYVEKAFLRKKA